jgi:hypothetical protein
MNKAAWCAQKSPGYSDAKNSIEATANKIESLRTQIDGLSWKQISNALSATSSISSGDSNCLPKCMITLTDDALAALSASGGDTGAGTGGDSGGGDDGSGGGGGGGGSNIPEGAQFRPSYICNLRQAIQNLDDDASQMSNDGEQQMRQSFSISSAEDHESQSSSSWSAHAGVTIPTWNPFQSISVGGNAGGSSQSMWDQSQSFKITASYSSCQSVPIQPDSWFDGNLVRKFGDRVWKNKAGVQLWPYEQRIAKEIVICTAPTIELTFSYNFLKQNSDSSYGGASVGINVGPFSFGGGGQGSRSNYNLDSDGNGQTIRQTGGVGYVIVGAWSTALRSQTSAGRMQMLGLTPPPSPLAVSFNGFDVVNGDVNVEVSTNRVVIKRSTDSKFKGEIIVQ